MSRLTPEHSTLSRDLLSIAGAFVLIGTLLFLLTSPGAPVDPPIELSLERAHVLKRIIDARDAKIERLEAEVERLEGLVTDCGCVELAEATGDECRCAGYDPPTSQDDNSS